MLMRLSQVIRNHIISSIPHREVKVRRRKNRLLDKGCKFERRSHRISDPGTARLLEECRGRAEERAEVAFAAASSTLISPSVQPAASNSSG